MKWSIGSAGAMSCQWHGSMPWVASHLLVMNPYRTWDGSLLNAIRYEVGPEPDVSVSW